MKKLIPLLLLFGCNTNQNYDKSMLPNADPAILSKVNSRVLITCMQIPTPLPPVPINKDHKIPQTEVYDTNDCIGFFPVCCFSHKSCAYISVYEIRGR